MLSWFSWRENSVPKLRKPVTFAPVSVRTPGMPPTPTAGNGAPRFFGEAAYSELLYEISVRKSGVHWLKSWAV